MAYVFAQTRWDDQLLYEIWEYDPEAGLVYRRQLQRLVTRGGQEQCLHVTAYDADAFRTRSTNNPKINEAYGGLLEALAANKAFPPVVFGFGITVVPAQ